MSLPLIALFIAAFAFGTTEFVIAGVLPQVAGGLSVTIPTAGYLVSGYAIGIAVGGPLLTLATTRFQRKILLIGLAIVFTAGQAACALAPDFASMLLTRVVVVGGARRLFWRRHGRGGRAGAQGTARHGHSPDPGRPHRLQHHRRPGRHGDRQCLGLAVYVLGDVRAGHSCNDSHDRPAAAHVREPRRSPPD